MSISRAAYWQDKAALLDPAAYQYFGYTGGLKQTVPEGETWYLLQAWNLLGPNPAGSSTIVKGRWWLRNGTAIDPSGLVKLTAGTTIQTYDFGGGGPENGYAYVCRPSLVVSADVRYREAEDLWYDRQERIKTLPFRELSAAVDAVAGAAAVSETFPASVTRALITHVSCHDGAWADLIAIGGNTINLYNEISDAHQVRYGQALCLPILTATFGYFGLQNATASGSGADAHIEALGHLGYCALPTDW